uniref:Uncharacterized protein n=1 Tax=Arundo donax TaxID=35708 RepID=A0A0A8YHU0_ARUDO
MLTVMSLPEPRLFQVRL